MEKTPLVLIVDDEPFNVDYLEQELEDLEYDTISAFNGQEALEQVAAHAPDMILLDIMMPVMDGFGVLQRLKDNKQWRDIPVVVISAMSDMDSVARGIELGAEDYLPKPFDPILLEARLTAGLEKKRLRDVELEYLQQVQKLTKAAGAIQNNTFDEQKLSDVAGREDALGTLARVFQNMAREVHAREQRLRQQIQQLQQDRQEQQSAAEETADRYLPMDRRAALAKGEELLERTEGAALFADISGFSSLTAALADELGKKRGAEEMTRLIKAVFNALIAEVHQYGGSVISFSGDAVTCWFDGQAVLRATACALAMQKAMEAFAGVLTPGGTAVSLTLKVAVAAGPVRRLLVGEPRVQQVEVLAGELMDVLDQAQQSAAAGEVVVAEDTVREEMEVVEWRKVPHFDSLSAQAKVGDDRSGEWRVAVVGGLGVAVETQPWPELPPLAQEQVRGWLLRPAYDMILEGTSQFMSELRQTHALFLKFSGLDYDHDPQAGEKLDRFVRWAQKVIDQYGGYVLQVTTGDKGSYIYANFGALLAHEDDAMRATLAALDLQHPPDMPFISNLQIGVASGEMCVGAYGSATRRTYGALGDMTNMAARLMVAASDGILNDENIYQAARGQVEFAVLPPIRVKGWQEPVPVFRPTAVKMGTVHHSLIDQLSPSEQLMLKIASVVGPNFTLEIVAVIYPKQNGDVDLDGLLGQLLQTGLIVQKAGDFAFANSLIHEAAYERMLFAQRRGLHRALATWHEQNGETADLDHHLLLANHWQHAEEIPKALQYLEKAAEAARANGDVDTAVRLYDRALKLEAQAGVLSPSYQMPAVEENN